MTHSPGTEGQSWRSWFDRPAVGVGIGSVRADETGCGKGQERVDTRAARHGRQSGGGKRTYDFVHTLGDQRARSSPAGPRPRSAISQSSDHVQIDG